MSNFFNSSIIKLILSTEQPKIWGHFFIAQTILSLGTCQQKKIDHKLLHHTHEMSKVKEDLLSYEYLIPFRNIKIKHTRTFKTKYKPEIEKKKFWNLGQVYFNIAWRFAKSFPLKEHFQVKLNLRQTSGALAMNGWKTIAKQWNK